MFSKYVRTVCPCSFSVILYINSLLMLSIIIEKIQEEKRERHFEPDLFIEYSNEAEKVLLVKTFQTPLSVQEEKECLRQMKEGSLEAKHILIERNMRLVAHVAKKYQNVEEDMEDMISIGTIGLIKAIGTYDDAKGSRLATYAARCIDNEILMYLRSRRKSSREVSLYEPIGTDKEGNQINLLDVMENDEPDVIEQMEYGKNVQLLYEMIPQVLTKREQEILCNRYGLKGRKPLTQREIARKMDISRSYVSRIEKKAIEKLKKCFAEKTD